MYNEDDFPFECFLAMDDFDVPNAKYCMHIMIDDNGFIYHVFTHNNFKFVFSTRSKHELRLWMDLGGYKVVAVNRYPLSDIKSAYMVWISS